MDKWKDGLKDEQALFYRTVPATTWVQKVQKKKRQFENFSRKANVTHKKGEGDFTKGGIRPFSKPRYDSIHKSIRDETRFH